MYTRILIPLDGSDLAEQVLPYAQTVASALGTPIELLRIIAPPYGNLADTERSHNVHHIQFKLLSSSMNYLNGIKQVMLPIKVPISCSVQEGDAVTRILSEAKKEPNTLIAMCTHGRSGISRWTLGSVTDKLLHSSDLAMLIVRARAGTSNAKEADLTSVIVPLDGSALAEQVLPDAVALAKALCLNVALVSVAPPRVEAQAKTYLAGVADTMRLHGISVDENLILQAQPANEIVDLTLKVSNSLVAMTTHGRSGVGRWVLGSVADRVVRHSGCPVLILRAKEGESRPGTFII